MERAANCDWYGYSHERAGMTARFPDRDRRLDSVEHLAERVSHGVLDGAEHRGQRPFDPAAHGAALVRGLGIEGQDGAVVLDSAVDVEQRDAAWGTGQPGAAALPLLRRDDTSASERPDDAPDHHG